MVGAYQEREKTGHFDFICSQYKFHINRIAVCVPDVIAPVPDKREWDGAWCRRWDSNPHEGLAQRILSPSRLPVPPRRQMCQERGGGGAVRPDLLTERQLQVITVSVSCFLRYLMLVMVFFNHTARCEASVSVFGAACCLRYIKTIPLCLIICRLACKCVL